MYSHVIIAVILVIGATVFGFKYLTNRYLQSNPSCDRTIVRNVLGLPILQIGVWALAFFALWAFLPSQNSERFFTSDFAEWTVKNNIPMAGINWLYSLQTSVGIQFLIFGGLAAYVVYYLLNKNGKPSTLKVLTIINTVFSGSVAWSVCAVFGTLIFLTIFGKLLISGGEGLFIAFIVILNIVILVWMIIWIVRIQKAFNKSMPVFMEGKTVKIFSSTPATAASSNETTKICPYCGETILAVAKKCKHCGEWIKEEDVVVEVKKMDCPICGEEIDASSSICPICHEPVKQENTTQEPKNAFAEKMKTKTSENGGQSSNNNKIWILLGIAAVIIIVVCVSVFSGSNESSSSSYYNNANDSTEVAVEEIEMAEEVPYDEVYHKNSSLDPNPDYSDDPRSTQGGYDDNTIHSLDDYNY